ncbi:DeoR family transcriptional regulator [Actinoplanes sp. SE50]|uniref:DeoR/GlpR family DNA-binding transcription regulator n=1 Tax=unclassified Actinoplanes TaxID=2626549 RepID=UPI00023ED0C4|nr:MULTISPECIES: DeoR/GlpR family DNA-binding transcription regulator [unclassified Actinoplanes]AEV85553.1 Glycerol-3-phosphate regulon repressor [Actinoplanes sp. SE50/110]ATO83946.1 DeoR family transcriptional regulator [Actinoplanes sp. SE50]SLM01356.1 DeoR family transcriptional regulator [Actinoplanes sp. SE50/110]
MLAAERRDVLLHRLRTDGKVVAKEVAAALGVPEDTIRRDLRELAAAGLCQRVYGGALPVSPALADYATRTTLATLSKQRVAAAAAALIRPGSTILLDGGTTALAVTAALPADLRATIVTHSPTVAAALVAHPAVDVHVLGGRLFKHSAVTCGAATVAAALAVTADIFLLGVTGVHEAAGLTTGDPDEAALKRILASRAAETYVLASSEKIGAASPFTVLPTSAVGGIITDAAASHPTLQALRAAEVAILAAP